MDVHARESGSPMRSNSVAPTYESREREFSSTGRSGGSFFLSGGRADAQYENRRTLTFITSPSAAAVVSMLEPP